MPAPRFEGVYQADPMTYVAALGSESVTVTFDAAKMTGRWERELRAAQRDEDVDKVSDLILGVFIGWDVVDSNDQPVELTTDLLLDLPTKALTNLIDGMTETSYPSSEEGNGSANTRSTPATDSTSSPENHPNGAPTSSLPTPSAAPSQT